MKLFKKKHKKKLIILLIGIATFLGYVFEWGQNLEWVIGLFEREPRLIVGPDNNYRGLILKDIQYEIGKPAGVIFGKVEYSFDVPLDLMNTCLMIGNSEFPRGPSSCNISFKAKNGEIVFDIKLYDIEGNFIAEILENQITGNQHRTFSYNFDQHGFELIDDHNNVLMSILYIGDNRFTFQGVIYNDTGEVHLVKDNKDAIVRKDIKKLRWLQSSLKKHFIYTGEDYLGKRSDYGKAKMLQKIDTASFTRIYLPDAEQPLD
nr:hypothetical protein [Allomuricauda sp.]